MKFLSIIPPILVKVRKAKKGSRQSAWCVVFGQEDSLSATGTYRTKREAVAAKELITEKAFEAWCTAVIKGYNSFKEAT